MEKLTKVQIRERQDAILAEMDEMELNSRAANNGSIKFSEDEGAKYDSLMDEHKRLSFRMKVLADAAELAKIRNNEENGKKLREKIQECYHKRTSYSTILSNSDADNVTNTLESGGLIPTTINEIIDTKVPGVELPDNLKMAVGVHGVQIIPYSLNDVQFSVEGEVTKVAEQKLDFAHIKAVPQRVAASVTVSHRAFHNASFDLIAYVSYKFRKGWAIFRALHIYAHGTYTKLPSPFAQVTAKQLTLDENIGKNLAKEAAELYDLGFDGDPEFIMDKTTEAELSFTKLIAGSDGNRTVVEGGRCVGYSYKVSPYAGYTINANGVASKDTGRYLLLGHFDYLAEEQHDEMQFNIDGTSQENFDRGVIALGMATDYSLTELSSKVNSNKTGKPQAFKLIKLVDPT